MSEQLGDKDKAEFLARMERVYIAIRASAGLPPEPRDAISNLINVKNELERSRFPTYGILSQIVYLKLGALRYGAPANALNEWGDLLCHALIEYKGQGRGEWVEAVKRAEQPDQTSFTFSGSQRATQPTKRRWPWSRKPKEQSEFKEQQ